jgi:hypothetical protein
MALTSTLLSNVPTPIYTSVGSSVVTAMYLCNSGNLAVHFTLYAVPNGNSASVNNAIYYEAPLTVHDTYVVDTEKLMLENGDSLQANLTLPANVSLANVRVVATVSSIGI